MAGERFEIPRVKSIDAAEFQHAFHSRNTPVVVEDYAKAWPAVSKWDARYLCDHLADRNVLCSRSRSSKHPDFELMRGHQYRPVAISFEDYMRHICTASADEIPKIALNRLIFMKGAGTNHELHLDFDGIKSDFEVPELIGQDELEIGAVWIQGHGVKSWLHCDPYENLYVQIAGRKRIELMHPAQSREVYYNNNRQGYCEVDAFDPDPERFPLYAEARIYETILEPGELLYMPIFWFHAVESLDFINISTNWWYRPRSVALHQPSVTFALRQLLIYGFGQTKDEDGARAFSEVGARLQALLLSERFASSEDFWRVA